MTKHIKKIMIIAIIIVLAIISLPKLNKVILKKLYPMKYEEYVEKYSKEYNVDKYLIYSVIKAESNFKENVVSNQKAIGLMQIMEETAKDVAEKNNIELNQDNTKDELFDIYKNIEIGYNESKTLYNPDENICLGTKYLSQLIKQYNGNYILAVTAYNAGIGNVNKWIEQKIIKEDGQDIENIPFKETNNYVRKIIQNYRIYKQLYEEI